MEKNRIVLFNILKKRTKSILQSLLHGNNNLIRDLRGLLEEIPGISKEELERVETVDDLWDFLVRKEVISMDDLQVLKNVARYIKSKELEEEVKSYEYESSGIAKTAKLVIRSVLSIGTGLLFLSFCGENESAKQDIQKKLVLPPLTKLHEVYEGSVCFVIETTSLSSLKQLWRSYKDGSLKKKFQKVINEIDEVRKVTQGTEVDVTVEIDEEEYREACWVLVLAEIEQAEVEQESSKSIQRPRRHSLSCEQDFLPTRDKSRFSWTALKEAENKLARETRRRILYVEKQNEKLRHEIEVFKDAKDTIKLGTALKEAENKLACETRRRIYVEKQNEKLRQEIEVFKGAKNTTKSRKEDVMAIEQINKELISAMEAPKTPDLKKVGKLKNAIELGEEILKIAVETDDQIRVGGAYSKTGVLYYALGTLYKDTNEKENCEDTMRKAGSYFREAADSLEKLNAQLNNEDELKSVVNRSIFITYKFLTAVLVATKQTEEALIVSDCTQDRSLVDTMIKKFQMNENEILSDSMRYANVSSILENKGFSILIFAVRDTNVDIWTLECQKPSFFLTKKVPNESEPKTSADTYITNLVAAVPESSNQEPLELLYELLIAPVLPNLTQDEVVIIADGPLHLVPFAALRNPKTGQSLSDIKCIRYAPSLAAMKVWKECPADYHGNTGALVIGDPDVGTVRFERGGIVHNFQVDRIPGALEEAVIVSSILNARPLIGRQATKDEVLKRLQDHLAVIHIAAMGNEKDEILLAPSASTREVILEEHDYLLTIKEVQEMCIQAELVVLSVSNSGLGEITMGRVNSMSRAFLAAGARAVVASLWNIDDNATLNFMISFYTSLKMGVSASKSLQNAMNDIKGEESYEDPKYWAPFFLIGDDVTISV